MIIVIKNKNPSKTKNIVLVIDGVVLSILNFLIASVDFLYCLVNRCYHS